MKQNFAAVVYPTARNFVKHGEKKTRRVPDARIFRGSLYTIIVYLCPSPIKFHHFYTNTGISRLDSFSTWHYNEYIKGNIPGMEEFI